MPDGWTPNEATNYEDQSGNGKRELRRLNRHENQNPESEEDKFIFINGIKDSIRL